MDWVGAAGTKPLGPEVNAPDNVIVFVDCWVAILYSLFCNRIKFKFSKDMRFCSWREISIFKVQWVRLAAETCRRHSLTGSLLIAQIRKPY